MMQSYHDLSDDQFEQIIVSIGQHLFGVGLMGFAKGKDGGKDAKFHGTAERYPSQNSPWHGRTIIQAKHTNSINASFSDKNFFNPEKGTGILCDEVQRIKSLFENSELENYLLISNRKITGITEGKIKKYLSEETGISEDKLAVAGSDQLDQWFTLFPGAVKNLNINPLDGPLIVSPFEMATTIEAFGEALKSLDKTEIKSTPTDRTTLKEKNTLNKMSEEYSNYLTRNYLPLTTKIEAFLSDPQNSDYQESYHEAAEEFATKIIEKKKAYDSFDGILNHLMDLLVDRSQMLRSNKKLTRAMLFYMYWHCDIGKNKDD